MSGITRLRESDIIAALGPRSRDPVYFAEEVLGVKLNPAQRRWFRLVARMNGDSFFYRRVVHVAANQIGKSLGLAILILWANHTKMGLPTSNWDAWLSLPFKWYHLAPRHDIALIVYREMVQLMRGNHPAQVDHDTGRIRPVLWTQEMWQDIKFDSLYQGIKLWNGAEIHFRTTDEKAKGIMGVVANGVSIDEAAFEQYLNEVLDQAVKLRLVSTGGPCWIVSTPDGINDFFEVVNAVLNAGVSTFHERVWEAPEERWALVWSHISDNVGFGLTQDEVDFLERDVDPATKEQQLRGAFISASDAFFTPQEVIKDAWVMGMPNEREPRNNHKYVIFWDPSVSSDPTVVTVLDITSKPFVGVYYRRWEKPMAFDTLLSEMLSLHRQYNTKVPDQEGEAPRATTGFDSTSMGGAIIRQSLRALRPQHPLNFSGQVKIRALTDMRASLARKDVIIPASWIRLQREVFGYRLDDKKIVQDSVMSMCGAVYLSAHGALGQTRVPFKYSFDTFTRR